VSGWTRVVTAALFMALWSLGPSKVASAQTPALALYVEGPDAPAVRGIVRDALPAGVTLADESAFRAEFVREGQNGPIGKDLDPAVIERVRRAARILGIAAVVVVRVRVDDTAHRALVLVVPAWKTPATAEETTLAFTSHGADVTAIAAVLGPSLAPYVPAPPPAPQLPPAAHELPSIPSGTALSAPRGSLSLARGPAQRAATSEFDLAVAGALVGRHFNYKDGIDPNGVRYTQAPAPATSVRGQLFPLPRADGAWRDIGIGADYLRIYSPMNDTSSVASALFASSYSVGLRARIHPGLDPRLILGLSLDYSFTSFRAVSPPQFELPNVTYRSVRPAIDTRVYFGRFSLLEEVAFHAMIATGDISTRFYGPHGYGLDAAFGGALVLAPSIEARLTVDYAIDSFLFDPPPTANFAAGGARDQLYGVHLGLGFTL
jgi:hypothetical protein